MRHWDRLPKKRFPFHQCAVKDGTDKDPAHAGFLFWRIPSCGWGSDTGETFAPDKKGENMSRNILNVH